MPKESVKIIEVSIGDLKPAEYNPRKWDDAAKEKLKESIRRHGFVEPVIVNSAESRRNVIIGGHFRVECAKELGLKAVPAIFLNVPDLRKEKELNLRLNRNRGEWDLELLRNFDTEFLLDIGFDDSDLSDIWSAMLTVDDDAIPEAKEPPPDKQAVAKLGDLYELGRHRLICGDSTDPKTVRRLTEGFAMDVVYCDPVYNIGFDYGAGLTTDGKYGGKADDAKSDGEYADLLRKSLKNALAASKPDCHVFYWCDESYIWLLQGLYSELGVKNRRVCFWVKNNFNMTPRVAFNKAVEPCIYGTVGSPPLNPDSPNLHEVLNREVSTGNRTIDDIVDIFDIWLARRDGAQSYRHPTQKPVSLAEKPLKRCSGPNGNVLDLFGGSGTTLLACEQLGRRAFLAEIDPVFCDVIISRFEEMTGLKAMKIN